ISMEVEDLASASLRYSNGALGSLLAGAHLAGLEPGSERIELFGPYGQLRVPSLYADAPVQIFLRRPWDQPRLAAGKWHTWPLKAANIFKGTVAAFARAALAGQAPSPSGRDAREVLALLTSLYRAAETHTVQPVEHLEDHHAGH